MFIRLNGIKIFAYHGVYPEEIESGNHFEIDLEAEVKGMNVKSTDSLAETLDYSEMYKTVMAVSQNRRYNLLEALASDICSKVFISYSAVEYVRIKVRKMNPPIGGEIVSVEVELEQEEKMHNAYIGIGTNIEPRSERLQDAINALAQFGIIEKKSSIYETAPYGFIQQADFLNAVILLQTELELPELHHALQDLEKELGRNERPRWHEREIDFDILFYDDVILDSETLTVPHSELHRRSFVLIPMAEIATELIHPVFRKNISSLLQELSFEKNSIHLFEK